MLYSFPSSALNTGLAPEKDSLVKTLMLGKIGGRRRG